MESKIENDPDGNIQKKIRFLYKLQYCAENVQEEGRPHGL